MSSNRQKQDSPQAREANLARIRDNQRRSRARRKEYMKECEDKVRQYEQQGISASKEIQECARDVAYQNRRLREMLRQSCTKEGMPITDQDIDRYLAINNDDANSFSNTSATPTSATHLQDMLNKRTMPYEPNDFMTRVRINSAPGPLSVRRPSVPFTQPNFLQSSQQALSYHLQSSAPIQASLQATTSPGTMSSSSLEGLPLSNPTYDAPLPQTMSTHGSFFAPSPAWDFSTFDASGEELCRDGGDLQSAGALHGIGAPGLSGTANGIGYNSLTNGYHSIAMNSAFSRPAQLIPG